MRVIANSLPKSGTHILIELLKIIGIEESPPQLSASLVSKSTTRNPVIRMQQYLRRAKLGEPGYQINLDNPRDQISHRALNKILSRIPDQRFLSAHLPYSHALSAFLQKSGFKVLYIFRDPRDVAVSYVNHMLRDARYPLHAAFHRANGMDERLRIVLRGCSYQEEGVLLPLGDRVENSRGWIQSPTVCDIKFEQIIGAKGGGEGDTQAAAVGKILRFLDHPHDSEELLRVTENVFAETAATFHKGTIGQWKEAMSPTVKAEFKKEIGAQLIELGYEQDQNW